MAKPETPHPKTDQAPAQPKAGQAHPSQVKTAFSPAEIEKIADLANLELTAEEKQTFVRQFAEILAYFRKIEAVETRGAEEAAVERQPPRYREDRAERSGISPAEFSPYLESGHFKVPKVIE
jgi:aspartyl/glutamyl-tRNA(Asn/Gln) amidotransferase C subunit